MELDESEKGCVLIYMSKRTLENVAHHNLGQGSYDLVLDINSQLFILVRKTKVVDARDKVGATIRNEFALWISVDAVMKNKNVIFLESFLELSLQNLEARLK